MTEVQQYNVPQKLNFLNTVWPESETSPDNVVIDFVFIHDFDPRNNSEHARATWTGDEHFWPQEFLPKSLADNIRVLIYGYNSISANTVSTHADNFLLCLEIERTKCPTRPMVFICHGFGGLIVKQTLIKSRITDCFSAIVNSTIGLIFFETHYDASKSTSRARKKLADMGALSVNDNFETLELSIPIISLKNTSKFDSMDSLGYKTIISHIERMREKISEDARTDNIAKEGQ